MAGRTRTRGRTASIRTAAVGALSVGGALVLLAAGCSTGRPNPPDMPPFAGTDAFLEEQARVLRAAEAEGAFQDQFRLENQGVAERRFRAFLMMQHQAAERARRQDLVREREQQRRRERERAEEALIQHEAAEGVGRQDLERKRERERREREWREEIRRAS